MEATSRDRLSGGPWRTHPTEGPNGSRKGLRERSRCLAWSGEMASGEVLGLGPASGMNSRLVHWEKTLRLGCAYHPDLICRTAVYVIRMYGGVGGERP